MPYNLGSMVMMVEHSKNLLFAVLATVAIIWLLPLLLTIL